MLLFMILLLHHWEWACALEVPDFQQNYFLDLSVVHVFHNIIYCTSILFVFIWFSQCTIQWLCTEIAHLLSLTKFYHMLLCLGMLASWALSCCASFDYLLFISRPIYSTQFFCHWRTHAFAKCMLHSVFCWFLFSPCSLCAQLFILVQNLLL